jgi:hypothetical protein
MSKGLVCKLVTSLLIRWIQMGEMSSSSSPSTLGLIHSFCSQKEATEIPCLLDLKITPPQWEGTRKIPCLLDLQIPSPRWEGTRKIPFLLDLKIPPPQWEGTRKIPCFEDFKTTNMSPVQNIQYCKPFYHFQALHFNHYC